MAISRGVALFTLSMVLVACTDASPGQAQSNAVVRDSAGVAIVESEAPDLNGTPTWSVSAEPTWSVGVVAGNPAEQFFNVTDARLLPDGRLLVVDGGAKELRFFDAAGVHLFTTGGEGDGPGEYQGFSLTARPYPGDSIVVYDTGNGRVSFLEPDGTFGRSISLFGSGMSMSGGVGVGGGAPERVELIEVFDDGSFLARVAGRPFTSADSTHVARQSEEHLRLSPAGETLDSLGAVSGSELFVYAMPGGVSVSNLAFGRTTAVDVHGGRVMVGENDGFSIEARSTGGTVERILRVVDEASRLVPESAIEANREERLGRFRGTPFGAGIEEQVEATPYPETLPAYRAILSNGSDLLWVERTPEPGDEPTEGIWYAFGEDGGVVGWMRTPASLEVTQIGADFLIGIYTDELDVDSVRMYSIDRR